MKELDQPVPESEIVDNEEDALASLSLSDFRLF